MPSHNTLLDITMHANKYLINNVLRKEYKFIIGEFDEKGIIEGKRKNKFF